jgi:hypothetical protein
MIFTIQSCSKISFCMRCQWPRIRGGGGRFLDFLDFQPVATGSRCKTKVEKAFFFISSAPPTRMHHACGVNDPSCIVHLLSMILHVKICHSAFQHDSHWLHTSKMFRVLTKLKRKKLAKDVWLDTPCRIHSWCQLKADPVKGLKMSRVRSAQVLTLFESSRTSWMTQRDA